MITLKPNQERVLDSLRDFFRQCAQDGRPEAAFQAVQFGNGSTSPVPYIPVAVEGLAPRMPYVCLRVPTGGGKTLLACYAAGLAMDQLMRAERAVVLWLVPSNTILDQTADALRDARHPYRHWRLALPATGRWRASSHGSIGISITRISLPANRRSFCVRSFVG